MSRAAYAGLAATVLAVTVAITGCSTATATATADGASEPVSTPSVTPSPTRTSVATPVATSAAADPIDRNAPATWIVTQDSMGPILLGAPLSEAIAAMPDGSRNDEEQCAHAASWSDPENPMQQLWVVSDASAGPDAPVELITWVWWNDGSSFAQSIPSPHTTAGVSLGTLTVDAGAMHPAAASTPPDAYGGTALRDGRIWLTTFEGHDRIDQLTVTTADEPPLEFCG